MKNQRTEKTAARYDNKLQQLSALCEVKRSSAIIVNCLSVLDPSPNLRYLDFIVRVVCNNVTSNKYKHFDEIKSIVRNQRYQVCNLAQFNYLFNVYNALLVHLNNNNALLPCDKDINQFKDFDQLLTRSPYFLRVSNKQRKRDIKQQGVDVIFENANITVLRIKTPEAAQLYCCNTTWCVNTLDQFNEFDRYYRGYMSSGLYLFMFTHRKTLHRWLFNLETQQFRNETNQPIRKLPFFKNVIQSTFFGHAFSSVIVDICQRPDTGVIWCSGANAILGQLRSNGMRYVFKKQIATLTLQQSIKNASMYSPPSPRIRVENAVGGLNKYLKFDATLIGEQLLSQTQYDV